MSVGGGVIPEKIKVCQANSENTRGTSILQIGSEAAEFTQKGFMLRPLTLCSPC